MSPPPLSWCCDWHSVRCAGCMHQLCNTCWYMDMYILCSCFRFKEAESKTSQLLCCPGRCHAPPTSRYRYYTRPFPLVWFQLFVVNIKYLQSYLLLQGLTQHKLSQLAQPHQRIPRRTQLILLIQHNHPLIWLIQLSHRPIPLIQINSLQHHILQHHIHQHQAIRMPHPLMSLPLTQSNHFN